MTRHFEIIAYRTALKTQVTELLASLLTVDCASSTAYFQWMFEQNPYAREPLVYVALVGGKVVGLRAFHGAEWRAGDGQTQRCPCAGGVIVDPQYRNLGLYRSLTSFALRDLQRRGYPLVFNWGASPVNYLASLRLGWRLIAPYQTFARTTPAAMLEKRLRAGMRGRPFLWRIADSPIPVLGRRTFWALDRATNPPELSVSSCAPIDQMVNMARRFEPSSKLRHQRDAVYFEWRYRNPLKDYRFLLWTQGRTAEGYVVLGTSRNDASPTVAIVDWEARDREVLHHLLEAAVARGRFGRMAIWSVTLDDAFKEMLRRIQFAPVDETRGVAGFQPGPLANNLENRAARWEIAGMDVLDAASWDLRMTYSDAF